MKRRDDAVHCTHRTDRHTWATERLPKLVKGVCRSVRLPEAGSTTARLPPALRGSEYRTNSLQPQHMKGHKERCHLM